MNGLWEGGKGSGVSINRTFLIYMYCVYKPVVGWTSCAYSLLMRANKLETALSRDRLACLAPPDMFFSYVYTYMEKRVHSTIAA